MGVDDWIQTISLGAVAVALAISTLQLRRSTSQLRLTASALEQNVHEVRAGAVLQLSGMLRDEPEVLAWHLAARGYPDWAVSDKRTIFALLRLQIHESTHLSESIRSIDPLTQTAWVTSLRADLTDPFYQNLWPSARRFFAPTFVASVDRLIAQLKTLRARESGQA